MSRRHQFSDLMKELEEEARREGPAAVQEMEALGQHYELAWELARRRKALGLTQVQLAKRTGLQQSEVSRYERGEGNPTWSTVQQLLSALGARVAIVNARGKRFPA